MCHCNHGKGSVEIIVGCMFSGKTEEAIRRLRRALIAKQHVVVFKPAMDKRYDATDVVSHNKAKIKATPVKNPEDILDKVGDATVVGIDEVQFFPLSIIPVIESLRNAGKRVIISGLDMDYRGNPFGAVPHLLAIADSITKLSAVCTVCGEPATLSQRLLVSEEQILVGEKEAYEARCRKHWSVK